MRSSPNAISTVSEPPPRSAIGAPAASARSTSAVFLKPLNAGSSPQPTTRWMSPEVSLTWAEAAGGRIRRTAAIPSPSARRMSFALVERLDFHDPRCARVDHPQRGPVRRRIVGDLLRVEFGGHLIFDGFAGPWVQPQQPLGHVARGVHEA